MELKDLVEKLAKEWEQFKGENDKRLKEVESKGRADPLTEEKINKHSAAVGDLQKQLTELQAKMNRPGVGGKSEQEEATETHRKAFGQFLRKGREEGLADLQMKAMTIGTSADGGYTVPQEMDKVMAEVELIAAPMRGVCNVIKVSSQNYEKLVNIHGMAGGWVAEGGARTATNSAQFGRFVPIFGELYAHTIASQRVIDDSMFNLEQHIAEEAGKTFGGLENTEFTSGAGSAGTSPKGILAYTPSLTPTFGTNIGLVKSGDAGAIDPDTLHDVPGSLIAGYRNGSVWMMGALTVAAIRKMRDTNGQYLWQPGLNGGNAANLLGFPVVENEDMPAIAADAASILFGNFKRGYVIADVSGTTLLRDPYTNKPHVVFYLTKRVGGAVIDTKALVAYKLSA